MVWPLTTLSAVARRQAELSSESIGACDAGILIPVGCRESSAVTSASLHLRWRLVRYQSALPRITSRQAGGSLKLPRNTIAGTAVSVYPSQAARSAHTIRLSILYVRLQFNVTANRM
jgi:hypothetical protein